MQKHPNVDRFIEIIRKLRAPGGCPWDREQTHKSLKTYLVEECYEVIDAIDSGDADHIREELGDLLLQIILHAQIAADDKKFTIDEVAGDIADKMIRRHPHVFGNAKAKTAGHVLKNWEIIKASEKETKGIAHKSILDGVPKSFPALFESYKIGKKVAKLGFDWKRKEDIAAKLTEEMTEFKQAVRRKNKKHINEEIGDVLFTLTNVCRLYNINPEVALKGANKKFRARFAAMEKIIKKEKIQKPDFKMWQKLWGRAKIITKIGLVIFSVLSPTASFAATTAEPLIVPASSVAESNIIDGKNNEPADFFSGLENEHQQTLDELSHYVGKSDLKDAHNLLAGVKALEAGNTGTALDQLKEIKSDSVLTNYAGYFRAKALIKLKKFDKALVEIPANTNPTTKISWERYWLRMEALAKSKNLTALQSEILTAKKMGKDKWATIKTAYCLGLGHFAAGDKNQAMMQFEKVLVQNPGTYFDKRIFALLKNNNYPAEKTMSEAQWNLRAMSLIKEGSPHEAVKIWERYYQHNPQYLEKLAYGVFKARDYKRAAEIYEKLIDSKSYKDDPSLVYTRLAQSYARQDSFLKAIEVNQLIVKKFPTTRAATDAEGKIGFLYFDAGLYDKAIHYLERYLNKGTKLQRDNALWYSFWSYYFTGKYDSAQNALQTFALTNKDKDAKVFTFYWQARIAEKSGKKGDAKSLYRKAADTDPAGYYGLLARQRLSGKPMGKTMISPSLMLYVPQAKTNQVDINLVKSAARTDPVYRAVLLKAIGLDRFAYHETLSSPLNTVNTADTALLFHLAGNDNKSLALGRRTLAGTTDEATSYTLAYPRAYETYVTRFSSRWGLDPNLAWSVMRQESAFKPEALSFAAAYGLMQVIPPTGAEIAGDIGFKNFHTDLLNEPHVSALFGTYYLSKLSKKFGGDIVHTIASYNAGPDAVSRWLVSGKHWEHDEFVELIPYKETKTYAKRVLINYLIYSRLYN